MRIFAPWKAQLLGSGVGVSVYRDKAMLAAAMRKAGAESIDLPLNTGSQREIDDTTDVLCKVI